MKEKDRLKILAVMRLRLVGKEVWGYGKKGARPTIGKLHVEVRGWQLCALTPLQPLSDLRQQDLQEQFYTEYIDKPFAFRGVHIGKSFTGPR